MGYDRPVSPEHPVTSPFKRRINPLKPINDDGLPNWQIHNGIDYGCPVGSEVVSASAGHVVAVNYDKLFEKSGDRSFGLFIIVETQNADSKLWFYYCHLDEAFPKPGNSVGVGTILGASGGYYSDPMLLEQRRRRGSSSGSHLHFGIKRFAATEPVGTWIDPLALTNVFL
mgnify:CR=1 FL=1